MIRLEIKKSIKSRYFLIAVALLYIMFMLGDSGQVLGDETSTTILQAICNKFHGNWTKGLSSSYLTRMSNMWQDNAYLPVVMPVICGFPSVINYLEQISTKKKRMIITRCSFKEYYTAKIIANAITAVGVSITAIVLFYATLLVGYGYIPVSDESFSVIYFTFSGKMIEGADSAQKISMTLIYMQLMKGILFFCLYSVINSSFCFLMGVLLQDKYLVLGSTIAVIYLQCRIYGELSTKYLRDRKILAGRVADLINPCFLHYAGSSVEGFYQHRTWLALLIAVIIIAFNYWLMVYVSQRQFDITER